MRSHQKTLKCVDGDAAVGLEGQQRAGPGWRRAVIDAIFRLVFIGLENYLLTGLLI